MKPIADLSPGTARGLRFVLFDIDDTITRDGRLLESSFSALWRLREAGYRVIPVTGRPAGWCDCIARQWPVDAIVGENGAFAYYMEDDRLRVLRHPAAPDPEEVRGRLGALASEVLRSVPGSRMAKDQFCRLYDVAVDFAEEPPVLSLEAAERIKAAFEAAGATAKISSIHVNAWFGAYDKLSMTRFLLGERYGLAGDRLGIEAMFFGDSPNDEPMFEAFPVSVGVANVRRYGSLMKSLPAYITESEFGDGFAEGVSVLLNSSRNREFD